MKSRELKVVGVGLNKTGTKTLAHYLKQWGFRHKTFDIDAFHCYQEGKVQELMATVESHDSFEDWPWPLLYREIDAEFPNARFVLTTRLSPDVWYRSLCNMAVRIGPLEQFERHIYGYGMPQGHREEHLQFYEAHNRAVDEHFRDRPGKLLKICWESGDTADKLSAFLGLNVDTIAPKHYNRSSRFVYSGDNLFLAHINRVFYQAASPPYQRVRRLVSELRRRLVSGAVDAS